jgi:hypothetical protein
LVSGVGNGRARAGSEPDIFFNPPNLAAPP